METLKQIIKWSLILAVIVFVMFVTMSLGEILGFLIFWAILAGLVIYFAKTILVYFGVIKLHKRKRYSKIRKSNIASCRFKEVYNYIENKYAKEL